MFTSIQIRGAKAKIRVLGVWEDTKRVPTALSAWNDACAQVVSGHNFSGKQGETTRIDAILFVGLGEKGKLKQGALRDLGGVDCAGTWKSQSSLRQY